MTDSARLRTSQTESSCLAEFEDYDSVCDSYNQTRIPVGVPIILRYLADAPIPLSKQTVLDAGCGTGNYLQELCGQVGKLHGLELTEGMMRVAQKRFSDTPDVQIDQGSITDLPFADETFDGVICNQVLHHLDHGEGNDDTAAFPNVSRFFHEAFRVLRPRGVLVINTTTHRQNLDGYWWAAFLPDAVDRMIARLPSLDRLRRLLQQANFAGFDVYVPFTEVLQGEQYLNPAGPLGTDWRAGDSTWSLATEDELSHALNTIRSRLDEGTMAAFLEEREKLRVTVGQTTFVAVRKPA